MLGSASRPSALCDLSLASGLQGDGDVLRVDDILSMIGNSTCNPTSSAASAVGNADQDRHCSWWVTLD